MSESPPKNGGEQSEDMVDRFLRLPASWQLGGVLILVVVAILISSFPVCWSLFLLGRNWLGS